MACFAACSPLKCHKQALLLRLQLFGWEDAAVQAYIVTRKCKVVFHTLLRHRDELTQGI